MALFNIFLIKQISVIITKVGTLLNTQIGVSIPDTLEPFAPSEFLHHKPTRDTCVAMLTVRPIDVRSAATIAQFGEPTVQMLANI